jgi:thiol-disulfide isomerase/thioredoxin
MLFIAIPLSAVLLIVGAMTIFMGGVNPLTLPLLLLFCAAYVVLVILGTFVIVTIMHFFVMLFRGKGGYSGTFNVFVYSCAAASIYQILMSVAILSVALFRSWGSALSIMILGLVGALWLIVIPIIGYKAIHKMGTFRAIGASVFPMILFVLIGLLINNIAINEFKDRVSTLTADNAAINMFMMKMNILKTAESKSLPIPRKIAAIKTRVSGLVNWQYDLNAALRAAQLEGKPVMADFYTDWCGWCKKLDNETYANKEVIDLSAQFVCAKVDGDKNVNMVSKYNIRGYPTIIFFSSKGEEDKRVGGYTNAMELANIMKNLLQKNDIPPMVGVSSTVKSYGERMKTGIVRKELRLGGIAVSAKGYKAMVNDNFVEVGDVVEGAKVVEVSEDGVKLVDQRGRKIVLRPQR